jgi:retinol-binding protein 3
MMLRITLPLLLFVSLAHAALPRQATSIDAKTRDQVISGALALIDKNYVFPDGAKKLLAAIGDKKKHGDYDKIATAEELTNTLTHDFLDVLHDRHLRVEYSDRKLPPDQPLDGRTSHADLEEMRKMGELRNFGFARVEVLDGNIGYLHLDGFFPATLGGATAVAAMQLIADTDALIIDLRDNHGGDPTMVQLLGGYLFEGDPVHFNDFVYRDTTRTMQYWTVPWVPGKQYLDKPVYVLTSRETFSCAEEFTYDLQTQKRSTTVGEATGGGAHPVAQYRITEHFGIRIPFARALNPITHTDWEGTGVKPDVAVPASQALAKAKMLAAQRIKPRDPRHGEILKQVVKDAEAELTKPRP